MENEINSYLNILNIKFKRFPQIGAFGCDIQIENNKILEINGSFHYISRDSKILNNWTENKFQII